MQIFHRNMKYKGIYIPPCNIGGGLLYCTWIWTRHGYYKEGPTVDPCHAHWFGSIFRYKVKTETPIVHGSMFNVRALKEAHRILRFNYTSINFMIPLEIDVHAHIIVVNIFRIDPAVSLNKTFTNCHIQNPFAPLLYRHTHN